MIDELSGYQVYFGFTRRMVRQLVISAIFVIIAAVVPMSVALRVAVLVLFGGGAVLGLSIAASRKVALRVDAVGVTICGSPLRYERTTMRVPWSDVAAIMLWRQHVGHTSIGYIGIQRRPDAPPVMLGRVADDISTTFAAHVPADVVHFSRAIQGWQLDREQLAVAVERFAPGVAIHEI